MLALTDIGFASTIVKKLAAANPEKYGAAAASLDVKATKALQRQKEQRQHEKNLKQGKHKPWAPPPKAEEPPNPPKTPAAKKPGPSGRKLTGSFKPKSKS